MPTDHDLAPYSMIRKHIPGGNAPPQKSRYDHLPRQAPNVMSNVEDITIDDYTILLDSPYAVKRVP